MNDSDYKYILDSLSVIQIGARLSYQEMLDNRDLSRKYRSIIRQDLLNGIDPATTLESHLYYMKPEDDSCRVYQRLKAKIRVYYPKEKKHLFGRTSREYEERILTPEELAAISPEQKELMGLIIAELQIPKVGLMSYAV